MASDEGQYKPAIIEDLSRNASEFSVFYAIHICENLLRDRRSDHELEHFFQDGLLFQPNHSYVYKSRNIHDFSDEEDVYKFVVNFLGLYGGDSPLPRCYHEQVAIQQYIHGKGQVPLQNFLDIFNNRFYWHYYQAWKKYRIFLQYGEAEENKVNQQVSSFIGLGPDFEHKKLPVNRFKLLQFSGVLSHRIRSKAGLLILLREFFPLFKIDLEEFVKSMVFVADRPRIGAGHLVKIASRLGQHALVGCTVADCMSRVCLAIGPLSFDDYLEFLPGGENATLLRYLLDLYLNDSLEYDVRLIIESESMVGITWNDERVKLGRSFWLGKPREKYIEKYIPYEKYAAA